MGGNVYDSSVYLNEYLGFHFAKAGDFCSWSFAPEGAFHFPQRCAQLCAEFVKGKDKRALDLGCAVGGASFELAKTTGDVLGVDYSHPFIDAANQLQQQGKASYQRLEEGSIRVPLEAEIDPSIDRSRVHFCQGDACDPDPQWGQFDLILAANLIDRLPDPAMALLKLPSFLKPEGILVITSPYTWLETFAPEDKWIGGHEKEGQPVRGLDGLKETLGAFEFLEARDLPFMIRETSRKFQWTVAQASVWKLK